MTIEAFMGLFIAMFFVAVIPGPAVFAISTASMSGGFRRGLNMTLGLLLADFVFILLAVSGLAFLAESLGALFTILKYFCAAYLMWMGVLLILSSPKPGNKKLNPINTGSDVFAGFLLTISNPKAIIFYVALFPAFINFNTHTNIDTVKIMLCAVFTFGSVNLGYAFISSKAYQMSKTFNCSILFHKIAGIILTITGAGVAVRA